MTGLTNLALGSGLRCGLLGLFGLPDALLLLLELSLLALPLPPALVLLDLLGLE